MRYKKKEGLQKKEKINKHIRILHPRERGHHTPVTTKITQK